MGEKTFGAYRAFLDRHRDGTARTRSVGAGYQLNTATGMRRPVRRIGDDDASLFFVVDRAAVESEDKCAVCQEEFTDKDSTPREAVRIECHCDHQVSRAFVTFVRRCRLARLTLCAVLPSHVHCGVAQGVPHVSVLQARRGQPGGRQGGESQGAAGARAARGAAPQRRGGRASARSPQRACCGQASVR